MISVLENAAPNVMQCDKGLMSLWDQQNRKVACEYIKMPAGASRGDAAMWPSALGELDLPAKDIPPVWRYILEGSV